MKTQLFLLEDFLDNTKWTKFHSDINFFKTLVFNSKINEFIKHTINADVIWLYTDYNITKEALILIHKNIILNSISKTDQEKFIQNVKKVLNDTFERRWMKHESDKYMNEDLEFYTDYYLQRNVYFSNWNLNINEYFNNSIHQWIERWYFDKINEIHYEFDIFSKNITTLNKIEREIEDIILNKNSKEIFKYSNFFNKDIKDFENITFKINFKINNLLNSFSLIYTLKNNIIKVM